MFCEKFEIMWQNLFYFAELTVICSKVHYVVKGSSMFYWNRWQLTQGGRTLMVYFWLFRISNKIMDWLFCRIANSIEMTTVQIKAIQQYLQWIPYLCPFKQTCYNKEKVLKFLGLCKYLVISLHSAFHYLPRMRVFS